MGTSWNINKNWSYTASVNFQSQFTKGYKSRTEHVLVSDFMAPGTLTPAVGIKYQNLKVPLVIQLLPVAGNMTFVLNKELNEKAAYGVPVGKKQLSTVGSAIQIDFNKKFAKDRLTYVTYLRAFTNYDENTNGIWNNTLSLTVLKFMTLSAFCSMKYEELAVTPTGNKLQWNYSLGVGLAYTFSNK